VNGFDIRAELKEIEGKGLRRSFKTLSGPSGPRVTIDGRTLLNFSSNDYLGLANNDEVKDAAIDAIRAWGLGSGSSRLVSGTMDAHVLLEERIRRFKGAEAVLLYNSGYHANLGIISALADRETDVFSDRLNHASIVDACVLSRANVSRYRHRDTDSLERLLKRSKAKKRLIATDTVFSMDGDVARLDEIAPLLDRYNAVLLIDDAHATGALGETGKGGLEHFSIRHHSIIQMGTLGKAIGSFGAFAAGDKDMIELLKSRSRPFMFTTSLPPAICVATIKAFDIIERDSSLVKRLRENSGLLRAGLKDSGIDTLSSETQIIPVLTGDTGKTMRISRGLFEKGLFIHGIRPPAVPDGSARLRLTACALHTASDIKDAIIAIREALCP
jgi:glycine C-acetyltransferase